MLLDFSFSDMVLELGLESSGSVSEEVLFEEKLFWGDLLGEVGERIVRSEVDIVVGEVVVGVASR